LTVPTIEQTATILSKYRDGRKAYSVFWWW